MADGYAADDYTHWTFTHRTGGLCALNESLGTPPQEVSRQVPRPTDTEQSYASTQCATTLSTATTASPTATFSSTRTATYASRILLPHLAPREAKRGYQGSTNTNKKKKQAVCPRVTGSGSVHNIKSPSQSTHIASRTSKTRAGFCVSSVSSVAQRSHGRVPVHAHQHQPRPQHNTSSNSNSSHSIRELHQRRLRLEELSLVGPPPTPRSRRGG